MRRGSLEDLDGLKEAAADSDGVIHVAHRQDLLPSGGMDAVAAAELPIMLAYGEALAGTGKPLVAAGSIGPPGNGGTWVGRPPRRLGAPAVSIPVDELMLPGYFGFLTAVVTLDLPASSLITRRTLGWEPAQPRLLADLGNGHCFPAS